MEDRLQKIEEMVEGLRSLKKPVAFTGESMKLPRITPSQWMVLKIIDRCGMCMVRDISHGLNMTSSAATQLVDGLVFNQYVTRKVNEKDRRKVMLTLSAKSIKHIERIKKYMLQQMLDVFKVLNDQEFEQFYKLNKKIADSLVSKYSGIQDKDIKL